MGALLDSPALAWGNMPGRRLCWPRQSVWRGSAEPVPETWALLCGPQSLARQVLAPPRHPPVPRFTTTPEPLHALPNPTLSIADLAATAPALLTLADDSGLGHLRSVALDYIITHYDAVAQQPAFAALSKEQVAMVAREACALHGRVLSALRCVGRDEVLLPDPVYQ